MSRERDKITSGSIGVPPWAEKLLTQLLPLIIALIGGSIIIAVVGENPLHVFATLIRGAFGNPDRIAGTLLQSTPIIISGIAACIAFRGGLFNIGIEGQLYVGGFAAAWVGFAFVLPAGVHVIVAIAAAILCGALWILIPAFFRARFGTNEVVSTILSNYVAILLTSYLTIDVFKRPGGWSETPQIAQTAHLPQLVDYSRLNVGLLIGLALAIGLQLFLSRTGPGYSMNAMGSNAKFAEYGGVRVKRNIFLILLASGAVGGLAGGIETLGVHHRFMEGFAPGFGFDGVIAALLANGSPLGVLVTAIFFGALRAGSLLMEVETTASREVITVFQGFMILCVSAQFLYRYQRKGALGERRWKF
ncbi:ABC transporter permease [Hoeflea sp.]|uniref:ABC transporter permease n=1 Tax=Hoeflea sp. TaxID=1940281 RepID=UPI00199F251D|nr:ABC transporter permease [Hoeflea sp.]MBC7281056.1 ABC transporter permease [Hoeflea sp.]